MISSIGRSLTWRRTSLTSSLVAGAATHIINRDNSVEQCNEYKKQETQREVVERIEIQSACNKKTHRTSRATAKT